MSRHVVYRIICQPTGEGYVGGTSKGAHSRWLEHATALRCGVHPNHRLSAAWAKHGEGAFAVVVLQRSTAKGLRKAEGRFLLKPELAQFNIALDPIAPMRGRRHTPEALGKVSARFKGKPKSAEHRAKIGAAQRGRKLSTEQVAMLRRPRGPMRAAPLAALRSQRARHINVEGVDPATGEVRHFYLFAGDSRADGFSPMGIAQSLKKGCKHKGLHWRIATG